MRDLDDYPNVKHNGKLYFQLGLLASLIAVYFIIELKTPASEIESFGEKEIIDISEKPFFDVFKVEQEPQKEIAKANPKPKLTPRKPIVTTFKPIDNLENESVETELTATDDSHTEDLAKVESSNTPSLTTETPIKKEVYERNELDELPTFKACVGLNRESQRACFNEQMKKYIQRNLRYPERAREKNSQGSILVEFIVTMNGTIAGVKPVDEVEFNDKDLEKEALRVINRLPNLQPGKVKGEPVNVRYRIPITFRLNN